MFPFTISKMLLLLPLEINLLFIYFNLLTMLRIITLKILLYYMQHVKKISLLYIFLINSLKDIYIVIGLASWYF